MINKEIINKIEKFVGKQPRSIQEIATHIGKNWRTADRYVEEIIKEYGSLGKKTFREGTRGALKIIYFTGIERAKDSVFQQEMEKKIFTQTKRSSFDPFEIYQHVDKNKKEVIIKAAEKENEVGGINKYNKLLETAKKQVLFMSGNLSFINFDDGKDRIFEGIENIIKKGINIKVICRIGIDGRENIERLLGLNKKYGKELIEIHHYDQPIRATIIDNKTINIKGIQKPTGREHEIKKKMMLFYTIHDEEWASWLSKIFWKMYNGGIGSEKRLSEIDSLEKLRK